MYFLLIHSFLFSPMLKQLAGFIYFQDPASLFLCGKWSICWRGIFDDSKGITLSFTVQVAVWASHSLAPELQRSPTREKLRKSGTSGTSCFHGNGMVLHPYPHLFATDSTGDRLTLPFLLHLMAVTLFSLESVLTSLTISNNNGSSNNNRRACIHWVPPRFQILSCPHLVSAAPLHSAPLLSRLRPSRELILCAFPLLTQPFPQWELLP